MGAEKEGVRGLYIKKKYRQNRDAVMYEWIRDRKLLRPCDEFMGNDAHDLYI